MMHAATVAPVHSPSLRSALDVCAFVEELPADATGELMVTGRGGTPEGAVFVENRRVCWAAARGLAGRLGDLLGAPAKLDAARMESIYAECKLTRVLLGEYLVKASP